jgi:hypothetical protein
VGRRPKHQPTLKEMETRLELAQMRPLYDFLFPKESELKWYVSPRGYSFVKIITRKEQAA